MRKTNVMLGILMLVMLSSLASVYAAEEHAGYVRQFECIDLPQECSNCTYVNVTSISYSNNSKEFINQVMNVSGDGFSFKYTFCNTDQIGEHAYCTVGDVDGEDTVVCTSFDVTPTGLASNLGFYFLVLILSAGVIIVGFWMKDAPITIFGTFGLYFLGLYILFNGIVGVKDLVTTWAIGLIILGIAAYISTRSAMELIT